jgi:AraC-like DNA-binding protein
MFKVETRKSYSIEDLTALQMGCDYSVSQLEPTEEESFVNLYRTAHVGYQCFRYGPALDQRLRVSEGFLSFGLVESDSPITWTYDQVIPNDALTVFPRDESLKAVSPTGFRANGISFAETFMANLAEQVYRRPLSLLLPAPGIYLPNSTKLGVLRVELYKWRQLVAQGANSRLAIVSRREESLALAILDALVDARYVEKDGLTKSARAMSRALEIIHNGELENISAVELCKHTDCSQRTLEKNFLRRFGVTPKRYIKSLRLAQVRKGLLQFDSQDCDSIIELAGIHGFWHMGQFAADYRTMYGELPSETLGGR